MKSHFTKHGVHFHHQKAKSLPSVVFRMNSTGSANFDTTVMADEPDTLSAQSLNFRLDAEESSLRRSASNVEQSSKFRLRDISPSRLRERRKGHSRKKSDKDKLTPSGRKHRSTSWLPASFQQMFPSYKSKSGDFKRLFKDVPETERLITDYSCALQRDILVHGRLYVSQNWLCFYANIFGWETLVTINLKHVTSMTKEKTALVIPNAVQVWTETEKYFFTSFVSRDSTFRSLFRIWQNVLSDEPVLAPALMKAVGKYLDVDSEEHETSSRCSNDELPSDFDDIIVDEDADDDSLVESEDPPSNDSPKESIRSIKSEDAVKLGDEIPNEASIPDIAVSPASPLPEDVKAESSETPTPRVANGTVPRSKSSGTPEPRRRFPFPFKKDGSPLMKRKNKARNKKTTSRDNINDVVHRDSLIEEGSATDSNEDDVKNAPVLCTCESHYSLECINEEYATNVDTMFEYLFTDCDFYRSMREARKDNSLDIEPWVEENEKKRRSVKYTINLNMTIGPKTSKIEEKQELQASEPGQYYVVESNVINEGIPYSDSFVVVQRYCVTKVDPFTCRLRVTATVKYVRPVWGFVKSIISKNSTEGLSSFFNFLKAYIRAAEDEWQKNVSGRPLGPNTEKLREVVAKNDEERERPGELPAIPSTKVAERISTLAGRIWRDNSWFLSFFTLLLMLLLVLNVYLGYRIISLERSTKSWDSVGLPALPNDWPTDLEEFRNLLYQQQHIHKLQFKRWQQVLSTSMQFLQQVQDSLKDLQQEVEKPLNV